MLIKYLEEQTAVQFYVSKANDQKKKLENYFICIFKQYSSWLKGKKLEIINANFIIMKTRRAWLA